MQSTDKEGETILSSHKKGNRSWRKKNKHLSDHTGMGPFLKKQCHLTRKGLLQTKQTAVSSHKKGTAPLKQTVVSSHKKRTASQTDKDLNKIVATDHKVQVDLWNLVTTCGMALRLEILIAGGSVSPQASSSSALKGYSNIFLIALETRPILYSG